MASFEGPTKPMKAAPIIPTCQTTQRAEQFQSPSPPNAQTDGNQQSQCSDGNMERELRQLFVPDIERFTDANNAKFEAHDENSQAAENRRDQYSETFEDDRREHLDRSGKEVIPKTSSIPPICAARTHGARKIAEKTGGARKP